MQTTSAHTPAAIEKWLCDKIANLLDIETCGIDVHQSMNSLGLDSVMCLSIIGELEVWLDTDLRPGLIEDFETVSELAQFLANTRSSSE